MDSKKEHSVIASVDNIKISRSHRVKKKSSRSRSRSLSHDSSHRSSHYRTNSSKRSKHPSKIYRERSRSRDESPERRHVSKERYERRHHHANSSTRHYNRKYESSSERSISDSSESDLDASYTKACGRDPRDKSKRENWTNKVCILGEKVAGFKMHLCRSCEMPILRYARLVPCKHVFCFTCGFDLLKKTCRACRQPVENVSQYEFGSLFVCEMKSANSSDGLCHRGYYSSRDLEAHHDFRHKSTTKLTTGTSKTSSIGVTQATSLMPRPDVNNMPIMRNQSNPAINSGPITSTVLTFNNPMAAMSATGPLSSLHLTNPAAAHILMGIAAPHNVNTSVNLLTHFHSSSAAPRPY